MASAELQRYAELRAKALAVKPEPKPKTITVAVFREPDEGEEDDVNISELDDEDFLWLRCSTRTSLAVVHKNCLNTYAEDITPPHELKLYFRGVATLGANTVGFLNTGGDDLVLLTARLIDPTKQVPLPVIVPIKAEVPNGYGTMEPGPSAIYPPIVAPHPPLPSWLGQPQTNGLHGIKPEYHQPAPPQPVHHPQPVYHPRPVYHPQPVHHPQPVYHAQPVNQMAYHHHPQPVSPMAYFQPVNPPAYPQPADPMAYPHMSPVRLEGSPVKYESQEMRDNFGSPANMDADADYRDEEGDDDDDDDDEQKPKLTTNVQLQQMFEDAGVETLEAGIKQGLVLLDKLKDALTRGGGELEDSQAWMNQIEDIRKQAQYQKSIVGVVGNTGAGKSSVINALLEEERLVPTNCMRACTAVVTEISYNHETDDPYRASIEFISPAEWQRELRVLFQDLMDGSGEVKGRISADSEAGIAWAKIKAVYPKKTKETLGNSTVEILMEDSSVKNILGSTREIRETDSLRFYKKLQRFVDSSEKSVGEKKDRDKKPKEMEYWPLIRVVKLYVKSSTLATGAVIVDLPGVHDANAARAAVAESYMQKCTGLWIVAPITRAVDDKSAHKLLGDSFRRQLLMDGAFSTVSFICSKSDDISVSEAVLSLHLEDELAEETDQLEELEKERSEKKRAKKEFEETKKVYVEAQDEVDELLTTYEELKDQCEAGNEVFAPRGNKGKEKVDIKDSSKKRKRGTTPTRKKSKKAKQTVGSDDESNFIVSDDEDEETSEDDGSDKENEDAKEENEDREPLTMEAIDSKIEELRATRKSGREEKQKITKQILEVKSEINDLDKRIKKLENKIASYCILARNKYSTGAIQNDFASGLEELDREAAEDADGENFDPEAQLRDYTEVANQLPVFCVSSRGYQKLKGRLKKDGDPPVFENIDQTGIPALQAHCTKLTEKGRAMSGRRFLTNLSQFCNSLSLWSSSDGTANHLSDTQKAKEARALDDKFKKLDKNMDGVILQTVNDMKFELADNIFDRYAAAIDAASTAAPQVAEKWGYKVNREDYTKGGYYWATYKAICRRNGEFANSRGKHDMNGQLSDPMIKILATHWEKTFTRRLPFVLQQYFRLSKDAITSFHKEVEGRAKKMGMGVANLHVLAGQLNTYGDVFKGVATDITAEINATQREINREFTPVIAAVMAIAYDYCTRESGPGSFARMKHGMESHVQSVHRTMFEQSTGEVKKRLLDMIKVAENKLEETTAQIFNLLERDYRSIFGGNPKQFSGGRLSREEDKLRGIVKEALIGFEDEFKKVAEGNFTPKVEVDGDGEINGVQGGIKEENDENENEKEHTPSRSTTSRSDPGMSGSKKSVDVGDGESEGG